MSVDSTDELDAILDKHRICPNGRPDNTCEPCKRADVEAKAALQSLIEDRVKKANSTGHWYVKSVQLDAYHNMAHYCVCGYRTSQRGAIDGHVEWQKAQLSNSKDTV